MALVRKGRKPVIEKENANQEETEHPAENLQKQETEKFEKTENTGRVIVRGRKTYNTPSVNDNHNNNEQTENIQDSLPAIPKLPSMPDLYGKPIPRQDQDNSKPRLTINELIRLNMKDLRELASCYNIT